MARKQIVDEHPTLHVVKFGEKHWIWELLDEQGHPICVCHPRHGARYYYGKYSCVKSARRFCKMLAYYPPFYVCGEQIV